MENDSLDKRTVKLVNNIIYTGNLKSRRLGGCKKLGLSKNALDLPYELRAYQFFLNTAALYVCKNDRGEIIIKQDPTSSSYSSRELEILLRRFIEWYYKQKSNERQEQTICKMEEGYTGVKNSIRNIFPEYSELIRKLEEEISKTPIPDREPILYH